MGACPPLEKSDAMNENELLLDVGYWIQQHKECSSRNEIKRKALIEFMRKE